MKNCAFKDYVATYGFGWSVLEKCAEANRKRCRNIVKQLISIKKKLM